MPHTTKLAPPRMSPGDEHAHHVHGEPAVGGGVGALVALQTELVEPQVHGGVAAGFVNRYTGIAFWPAFSDQARTARAGRHRPDRTSRAGPGHPLRPGG